ncbi:tetratricopeptide repeat protein [Kribbella sp. NBC_01245]|uniref:AfsR/SARP family transcriptional regulator n=1 Tax=Kribbella sp. NBC_01245 TaxID=2903578 RepID=UPI002E2B32A3|nr:BTAD domain-containing putative transcriptional regulator [Kribbella sp. NBC_01245]
MTEIRLLGQVEVWADGAELDVGSAKPRLVLAALAVAPGRVVPTEVIVDRVWGDHPPNQPAATLYPYLSSLRRALRDTGIGLTRRGGGYVLDVPETAVDAVRFAQGLIRAKEREAATADLREAIGLWRGVPLSGLDSSWAARYRESLSNDRLSAWLLLAERMDASGALGELSDDLALLIGDYPLSEPLCSFVIRALVCTGRRAEALRCYAQLRERLIDELGVEPSEELQSLHLAILRRESKVAGRRQYPTARDVPRQLPPITRHFAGRDAELTNLDTMLAAGEDASAVVISAIAGTAGIGKTTLALHWAHRVADRFPDGQLFVELHGFDPTGKPTAPAEAVRACLDALGAHPDRVPQGLEEQVALFRSLTADRRLLMVLDNARDAEQVRPLIPAAQGSVVLVTSRNHLTGLIAEFGAHSITLDLLSPADAETLLSERIGSDRVATEPAAAATLAQQCNYLPLALSVLAAEAAQTPELSLATLADQLADGRHRLDRLDTADPMTSVRTVLSWSYDAQDPAAQRLFGLLGLHPGPDISVSAAASLAGSGRTETALVLRRLCRATLLSNSGPDRHSHHDLLRAYAGEVAAEISPADRDTALRRVLDHYLHTAYRAVGHLNPSRDVFALDPPLTGVQPDDPVNSSSALDWFAAELSVLVRLVDVAAGAAFPAHCWQLADLVARYLGRQGRCDDAIAVEQVGLAAAQTLDDPGAMGLIHRGLAYYCARTGRHAEGREHIHRALELARASGDRLRLAYALGVGGFVMAQRPRYRSALAYAENSLALYEAEGSRPGQLRTLVSIGWYLAQLGEMDDAIVCSRRALEIADESGDLKAQAAAHDTLGYLNRRRGQHDEAIRAYQQAVQLFGTIDDRFYVATGLQRLGDVQAEAGDLTAARETWARALVVFEELGHPLAEQLRDKLNSSEHS